MQIELPPELVERVRKRAAGRDGATEAEVIRQALDSLDWHDLEVKAIQEGIDVWRAGDVRSIEEFDAEFRAKNGIR